MNQRRPKLGDILDDYCTRERRLTNHAIVAMVEDEVKLTRCTTCDTEHDFKNGKMPTLRRKKDAVSTAYKEVLAAVTGESHASRARRSEAGGERAAEPASRRAADPARPDEPLASADDREAGNAVAERDERRGRRRGSPGPSPPHPRDAAPAGEPRARPAGTRVHDAPADRPRREVQGRSGPGDGRPPRRRAGGGPHGGQPRGPVFGRPPDDRGGPQGGRVPGRGDAHRPHRGGQPGRPGKKHSR